MILLIPLFAVAVGIGLIRGGRISNLAHIKIRRPWLIFLSVLVEYALIYLMRNTSRITQPLACLFLFLQYLLLFLFLWENRTLSYSWLIGVGSFLNFVKNGHSSGCKLQKHEVSGKWQIPDLSHPEQQLKAEVSGRHTSCPSPGPILSQYRRYCSVPWYPAADSGYRSGKIGKKGVVTDKDAFPLPYGANR